MTRYSAKLAGNAGPWTRSLVEAANDDLPVPIAAILNPDKTPARFLPWLAAGRAVRLWWEDWSDERKRAIIADWPRLSRLIGTRAAAAAMLRFVDGELVDKVSHPTRFVFGRAVIGRTPVGHPAFVARHLVKVATVRPPRSLVFGRGRVGGFVLRTPSRERLRRCIAALNVAKAPDTEFRVDFAHKRPVRLDDAIPIDGSYRLGSTVDRKRL